MQQNSQAAAAEANISEFPKRNIHSVERPESLADLQLLLEKSRHSKTPLYTVSTGKNWSMGSKQPVTQQNAVVVLERMNRIVDVNANYRYAIIEPGVTQKQLSDFLLAHHPQLKFPVTGSGENTSIIGNMLERGVAFGHRNKQLVAMEVLLASGKLVRTGLWHYFQDNNPLAFHYPFGHGPDLRGLFTQSNLGITTKMVIRLQLKKDTQILTVNFTENHLQNMTDTLRGLYEQGILDDGILITNLNDPRTTSHQNYSYKKQWVAFANFSGDSDFIQLKREKIEQALHLFKHALHFLPSEPTATAKHPYHNALIKAFQGIPTNYSLETMAAMTNIKLDNDDLDANSKVVGLVSCLPAVPFEGKRLLEIKSLVDQVSQQLGIMAYHNFASFDELTFEGFYRTYFDREDKNAVKKAHLWQKTVHCILKENGFLPYRIDNQCMEQFTNSNDEYWQLTRELKTLLDPDNIISPKKYNLT